MLFFVLEENKRTRTLANMSTKTIINCMDSSCTTTALKPQGISIIIDPTKSQDTQMAGLMTSTSSMASNSNIIKIQHSCQTSPNNNKLLIDINRKEILNDLQHQANGDHDDHDVAPHSDSSLGSAVVKVNCLSISSGGSREILNSHGKQPMGVSIKLETPNTTKERQLSADHNDDHDEHDDDHLLDRNGQEEKEPMSMFNESGQTSMLYSNSTSINNETINTINTTLANSAKLTTIAQTTTTTSQQVNGNSKFKENNGHLKLNQQKTNDRGDHDDDDHHHHEDDQHPKKLAHHNHDQKSHDDKHHNDRDLNDHDDDEDDSVQFTGIGKRDSCLDFSHGKRWPVQENSNSLLTKADTFTTSSSQPKRKLSATSVIISENDLVKENFQDLKENSNLNPNPNKTGSPTAAAAHVVKIQINPKNNSSSVEKQISIVKIESNLSKQQENENQEIAKENEIKIKKEEESEIVQIVKKEENLKKSELHLNLERMVQQRPQQPHSNNTVTIMAAGAGSINVNNSNSSTTNATSTSVTELNVSNPNYMYYSTMSSGQFSPCDTLDSGTGSDLESQQHSTPTAHLLLNKKSSNNGLEMHLKTTKIRVSTSGQAKDQRNTCSSYTDSEESEASSLSCDSLHSSEFLRQSSASPVPNKTPSPSSKILGSYLPDSLLRDIKNLKLSNTEYEAENENEEEEDHIEQRIKSHKQRQESYEPISSQDYMMAQNDYVQTRNSLNVTSTPNNNTAPMTNSSNTPHLSTSLKRASLPSKTFVLNQEDGTFIDMKMNSMPRKYEADKYYNFHVNEHENFRTFGNNNGGNGSVFGDGQGCDALSEYDSRSISDDVFAGYKDIRCGSATSTIRSNKGTVRGVKNRVRNGIATFLQLQQPNMKVSINFNSR